MFTQSLYSVLPHFPWAGLAERYWSAKHWEGPRFDSDAASSAGCGSRPFLFKRASVVVCGHDTDFPFFPGPSGEIKSQGGGWLAGQALTDEDWLSRTIRVSPGEIKRREYVVLDWLSRERPGSQRLSRARRWSWAQKVGQRVICRFGCSASPAAVPPLLMTVSLCECPTQPSWLETAISGVH